MNNHPSIEELVYIYQNIAKKIYKVERDIFELERSTQRIDLQIETLEKEVEYLRIWLRNLYCFLVAVATSIITLIFLNR